MPQISITREQSVRAPRHRRPSESIFSVDVEDWFHILEVSSAPSIETWHTLPSHVERTFRQLLEMFASSDIRVTCFFLGWIADRFPHLVKEAMNQGHEIASHGYAHRLVPSMTREAFREDAARARKLLEDIAGCMVNGYRAAGFSCIDQTPWAFDMLIEAGYKYDSSVFPAARQHGGIRTALSEPHKVRCGSGVLAEFPVSVSEVLGKRICFFGGGYLRLFPHWVIQNRARSLLKSGRPVIYYIHPREIDPDHPRLAMPLHRQFKSYVNLSGTAGKIKKLTQEFSFITFHEYLNRYGDSMRCPNA